MSIIDTYAYWFINTMAFCGFKWFDWPIFSRIALLGVRQLFDCSTARKIILRHYDVIKWNHFSALLIFCAGNPSVFDGIPSQGDSKAVYLCCQSEQTLHWPVIRHGMTVIWRRRNGIWQTRPLRHHNNTHKTWPIFPVLKEYRICVTKYWRKAALSEWTTPLCH